ncbi:MAG: type II secretion system GspH family protein [Planctomycetota bacterium]|jgi:prepilin-type N-terminal cleavage/methylation domain-containing protein|nr:type II secretion system GspH family protein [Planctomycetota bacterium]
MFSAKPKNPGAGLGVGGRRGMTLLEIVISLGILSVALLSTLGLVMSVVEKNKLTGLEISALHTLNQQMELVLGLADDNLTPEGERINKAHSVLKRFRDFFGGAPAIGIGPNGAERERLEEDPAGGRLVYRFWVPAPGQSQWLESDPRFRPNRLAEGEMSFYLDEYQVNETILPAAGKGFLWRRLEGGVPVEDPEAAGFDMNLDGAINDAPAPLEDIDIAQLLINITLIYYSEEDHRNELHRLSRFMMITDIVDPTEGMKLP